MHIEQECIKSRANRSNRLDLTCPNESDLKEFKRPSQKNQLKHTSLLVMELASKRNPSLILMIWPHFSVFVSFSFASILARLPCALPRATTHWPTNDDHPNFSFSPPTAAPPWHPITGEHLLD